MVYLYLLYGLGGLCSDRSRSRDVDDGVLSLVGSRSELIDNRYVFHWVQ